MLSSVAESEKTLPTSKFTGLSTLERVDLETNPDTAFPMQLLLILGGVIFLPQRLNSKKH